MPAREHRSSNRAIVLVGILMGAYLVALIAVGYLGQQRLRSALLEQEQLSIDKQAIAIGYLLARQWDQVAELGKNPAIQNFLSNRNLGKSMRDGLRADLAAISRELEHLLDPDPAARRAAFDSIAFIENSGHVLVEASRDSAIDPGKTYLVRDPGPAGQIGIRREATGSKLTFTLPVMHDDRPAGHLSAVLDASETLRAILADGVNASGHRRAALVGPDDEIVLANTPRDWSHWRASAEGQGEPMLLSHVPGTRLSIISFPGPSVASGFVTSPMFLGALALISLPLLAGLIRLLRLNNHNLVLQTHYQATTQQRAILHDQNQRLQREIDKRLESEQKLAHQANFDQLTGLPNRNLAMDRLAQAIKAARRDGSSVLILFLDLDRFKQVNDSLGHAAGDELLREAAQRLSSRVRESDTVSRLGGDEFLVICPEMPGEAHWEHFARLMLKALVAPFYIGDHEFFVGASIGIAAYPHGGEEPLKLLKNADIAMYAAKEQGRNRYCYYDPSMDAIAIEGLRLENNLRHALARNEFHLVYQPIVELSSGQTVAVEALLRWTSQDLGSVSPEKFIPIAEETGVIHEIGEWVLMEACRTLSTVPSPQRFRIAVNLSSKQFSRPGRLLDCVLLALRQSGLAPSQLELEVTETILIDDRPEIADLINQLDRIGVRLSIDDFGTGYSALNYLQRFPFDVLKIDRSFTHQVPGSDANVSLIRAIIAMAHALELEVVAEGIERRDQAGFLLVQHCEYGQGYLYSRPMTAEQLRVHLGQEQAIPA